MGEGSIVAQARPCSARKTQPQMREGARARASWARARRPAAPSRRTRLPHARRVAARRAGGGGGAVGGGAAIARAGAGRQAGARGGQQVARGLHQVHLGAVRQQQLLGHAAHARAAVCGRPRRQGPCRGAAVPPAPAARGSASQGCGRGRRPARPARGAASSRRACQAALTEGGERANFARGKPGSPGLVTQRMGRARAGGRAQADEPPAARRGRVQLLGERLAQEGAALGDVAAVQVAEPGEHAVVGGRLRVPVRDRGGVPGGLLVAAHALPQLLRAAVRLLRAAALEFEYRAWMWRRRRRCVARRCISSCFSTVQEARSADSAHCPRRPSRAAPSVHRADCAEQALCWH